MAESREISPNSGFGKMSHCSLERAGGLSSGNTRFCNERAKRQFRRLPIAGADLLLPMDELEQAAPSHVCLVLSEREQTDE